MVFEREPGCCGGLGEGLIEQLLGRDRQIDVGDGVARAAHEVVVMMIGELLAELEQRLSLIHI